MSAKVTGNWNKIVTTSFYGAARPKSGCWANGAPERDVYVHFYDQIVAVKVPRFRIAWLVVAVAIAALNFAAIRAIFDPGINPNEVRAILLLLGALPMANVLVVGMLIGQQRPGSRRFLMEFVGFGATALTFFIAFTTKAARTIGKSSIPKETAFAKKARTEEATYFKTRMVFFRELMDCRDWTGWVSTEGQAFSRVSQLNTREYVKGLKCGRGTNHFSSSLSRTSPKPTRSGRLQHVVERSRQPCAGPQHLPLRHRRIRLLVRFPPAGRPARSAKPVAEFK